MFAAKMIELDEKLRHLHERIDDGEHEDISALMCELNALTEEYNLEQDAIRYRLKECKVPKIQALISMYNDVQERMHNAAESDQLTSSVRDFMACSTFSDLRGMKMLKTLRCLRNTRLILQFSLLTAHYFYP